MLAIEAAAACCPPSLQVNGVQDRHGRHVDCLYSSLGPTPLSCLCLHADISTPRVSSLICVVRRKKTGAPAVGSGAAVAKSKQPPADKSQRVLMALHDKLKATGAVNEKVRDSMSV